MSLGASGGEAHELRSRGSSPAPSLAPSLTASRPIAIVGIGCRYADLRGPTEFWEMVRSGRNTVREVPAHRIELGYDIDHFYDPRPGIPGKICSRLGGFLDHPELFDPAAFGLTPRDAIGMEPQQRLMIEVTWDALADAGIPPESLEGERVAVILGFMAEDYSRQRAACLGEESVERRFDVFLATGISHAVMSGRISHLLGVTGPSFTLDTACSSSLYATHLACESLQRGETRLAIAGGANVFLTPEGQLALSRSGMMSPDGKCKAFDAGANGFVRAEGAGVVVLRPLEDALAAGDPIYAVIRGTGVSADGRDGGHMMAPGRRGQAQAMRDAYARAGIDPARVHYVETHGTGTVIGDPVEIGALADVMGPGRSPDEPLLVASVKGNLGHAESASGVAGLIKTALSIRHRTLPAQLHFESPSPAIPWDEIPVRVQRETTPWPRPGKPLAAVNSFGISGTNAHVILEAAPGSRLDHDPSSDSHSGSSPDPNDDADSDPVSDPNAAVRPSLLTISAQDPVALEAMIRGHRDAARSDAPPRLVDLGYTLGCRLSHRPHRIAVVADSPAELADELEAQLAGVASGGLHSGQVASGARPSLVMVFPGQGAQWLGMGRGLLAREPAFRDSIERLDAAYARHVDWSLVARLEGRGGFDWRERLDVLQPLLIALEIALAELYASFGVRPDRVIGQSLGEVAAAHIAGCLSLETTARLACERGRVVARAGGRGAMGVVAQSREELESRLARVAASSPSAARGRVEVAGTTGPGTTLVAGDRDAVLGLLAQLEREGVFARRLEVDFASHCFHMDPLLEGFRERLQGLHSQAGERPFVSTAQPGERSGEELGVDYWVRNLRAPVCFREAVEVALDAGADVFLELSPHATLARPIQEIAALQGRKVRCLGSLQREQDESRSILGSLAGLHVQGVGVDFAALHPGGSFVPTPLYAYQRRPYWFGERTRADVFRPTHPLVGARREDALDPRRCFWDLLLDLDAAPWLADHRLVDEAGEGPSATGRMTLPAALFIELALAASEQLWPGERVAPTELEIRPPRRLPERGRIELQLVLVREGPRRASFQLLARDAPPARGRASDDGSEGERWRIQARGRLGGPVPATARGKAAASATSTISATAPAEAAASAVSDASQPQIPVAAHLERLARQGLRLGERMQTLKELRAGPELLARLRLPRLAESEWYAYHAHPAIVECVIQLVGELLLPASAVRCVSIDRIRLDRPLGSDCRARVVARGSHARVDASGEIEADIELFDREGAPLGRIERLRAVAIRASGRAEDRISEPARHGLRRLDRGLGNVAATRPDSRTTRSQSPAKSRVGSLGDGRGSGDAIDGARTNGSNGATGTSLVVAGARGFGVEAASPAEHGSRRDGVDCVVLREWPRPAAPGRGEVEIEVRAAALETFDVLDSLGLARASRRRSPALGRELAGIVRACGEDVTGLRVGDRVLGFAAGAAARFVVVPASAVVAMPSWLDFDSAAGLPLAYAVAYFALFGVGGLQAGHRVLLRSAGGGVGLAAAAIATAAGAHVFATASSAGRRAALRARGALILGAADVDVDGDSDGDGDGNRDRGRDREGQGQGDFEDAGRFSSAAAEQGFDLILEATGMQETTETTGTMERDSPRASIAMLRPGGCLVDLTPRQEFELGEGLATAPTENRRYAALDLAALFAEAPQKRCELFEALRAGLESGRWPALPVHAFPVAEAGRALRFMAQNRHVGRVVLDFSEAATALIEPRRALRAGRVSSSCRVVVTGERPEAREWAAKALEARGIRDLEILALDRLAEILVCSDAAEPSMGNGAADDEAAGDEAAVDGAGGGGASGDGSVGGRPMGGGSMADLHMDAIVHLGESEEWTRALGSTSALPVVLSAPVTMSPERLAARVEWALAAGLDAGVWLVLEDGAMEGLEAVAGSSWGGETESGVDGPGRAGFAIDELLGQPSSEQRRRMHRFVGDALAAVLSLGSRDRAALDLSRPLDELGLDSLMRMELFVGLARELDLELAADWFPPRPSIAEVADTLLARLDEAQGPGSARRARNV